MRTRIREALRALAAELAAIDERARGRFAHSPTTLYRRLKRDWNRIPRGERAEALRGIEKKLEGGRTR